MSVTLATQRIDLVTGRLDLHIQESRWPLERLLGFAARNNPRRGYLFVSRVLGRHWPADPAVMDQAARDLAGLLPPDLPGPVLVVGLAETALALGLSVFRALRTRRIDCGFLPTTRHRVHGGPLLLEFSEPHSHAPAHWIHAPADPALADLLEQARSLVLVDDELSTGTTLTALAEALARSLPRLEQTHRLVLADWTGGSASGALLTGRFTWTPQPEPPDDPEPPRVGLVGQAPRSPPALAQNRTIRRGVLAPPELPAHWPDWLRRHPPGRRVLVLGCGEFVWAPFRLAELLTGLGHQVRMQAITRSPIREGGAIRQRLCFAGMQGESVPMYLYNFARDGYDSVILAHEAAPGAADPALLAKLGAEECSGWGPEGA